jgi:hypothetical protein
MHYDEVIALSDRVFADVAIERFKMLITRDAMANPDEAYEYAGKELMGRIFVSDAGALRNLADVIANDPAIDAADRRLDVALAAAGKSLTLAGENDPRSLSTLAMVNFRQGNLDDAVKLQSQAWFIAAPGDKPEFERTLRVYQRAKF